MFLFSVLYFIYVYYPTSFISYDEDQSLVVKNHHHKLVLSWKLDFTFKISLLSNTKPSSKASSTVSMTPRKEIVTFNGATSKVKAINSIERTVPLPTIDQPHPTEDTGSPSPLGTAVDVQAPLPQYEDQLLQMHVDIKEQMKEQHAQSDRDWKHATLDRQNAICEQEVRQLNEQLPAYSLPFRTLKHRCS